jgi:hypothetical protein
MILCESCRKHKPESAFPKKENASFNIATRCHACMKDIKAGKKTKSIPRWKRVTTSEPAVEKIYLGNGEFGLFC